MSNRQAGNEQEVKFIIGYKIGLEVDGVWWKSNKERLMATGIVKDADENYDSGRIQITLALLPLKAFQLIDWKGITEKRRQEIRDEILREFPLVGWTVVPIPEEWMGEEEVEEAEKTIDTTG